MTTKTFTKRFNAQRAARTALKNPKAEEGKDFATVKNNAGQWTFTLGIASTHIADLHKSDHPAAKANAESWNALPGVRGAHSDDRVHLFRRIATTHYDRSRPV